MGAGVAALGYATTIERQLYKLRTARVPVLAPGTPPLRRLDLSDLPMLAGQRAKQRWVAALARTQPNLVVNTGDNLAHHAAVPATLRALGPLLDYPGLFVFGSNDYYGPKPKNPARYLMPEGRKKRVFGARLPWRDLRAGMIEHGWHDVTHVRRSLDLGHARTFAAGVDDPHLQRDRYTDISGLADRCGAMRHGVTHSPAPKELYS